MRQVFLMLKKYILIIIFFSSTALGFSQSSFNLPQDDYTKVRFQLINNLIIFPVEVNGIELSFILDSGVSKPILFNIINLTDSLQINDVENIYLRGLGADGDIKALRSKQNLLKIGDAINVNQDLFVVFDNSINFTPRLGVNIHGIIGYDIFKDFVVEINYTSEYLKLYRPDRYKYKKCKKCETVNITLNDNKPYLDAAVEIHSQEIPVKLLVDTGSSDAIWLFETSEIGVVPQDDKYFNDFLGIGLSGHIYGKRSKINKFMLKGFELENVNVAFPDSISISSARKFLDRNGSISGEILKRFNLIFDYKKGKITFKKNSKFKKPFNYDKSGLIVEQDGVRVVREEFREFKSGDTYGSATKDNSTIINLSETYRFSLKPAFKIVELRKGSPGERAGLLVGDIILTVNGKDVHTMSLQDLTQKFSDDNGKHIKLLVDRNGIKLPFSFKLENPLK